MFQFRVCYQCGNKSRQKKNINHDTDAKKNACYGAFVLLTGKEVHTLAAIGAICRAIFTGSTTMLAKQFFCCGRTFGSLCDVFGICGNWDIGGLNGMSDRSGLFKWFRYRFAFIGTRNNRGFLFLLSLFVLFRYLLSHFADK